MQLELFEQQDNRGNFLIIDTETTKAGENMENQSVFDIGWTISDPHGNFIKTRSFIVHEFLSEAIHKKKAFLIDNETVSQELYIKKLNDKYMIAKEWTKIISLLKSDLKKYQVEYLGAYNLSFDKRVIEKTDFFLTGREMTLFDDYFLIDIYPVATHSILNTDEYRAFADKHNLKTEKGNYQTGAEATYRYIFNDLDYIEEHTACTDSIDETKILHYILKHSDTIPLEAYKINPQAWRMVQPIPKTEKEKDKQ